MNKFMNECRKGGDGWMDGWIINETKDVQLSVLSKKANQ